MLKGHNVTLTSYQLIFWTSELGYAFHTIQFINYILAEQIFQLFYVRL